MSRWWTTKRRIVGLLLLGALGAGVFAQVWGIMTAISLPDALEPLRAEHPRIILYWINVLYLGAIFVTLLPAAIFWLLVGAERRITSAVLASAPLVALLLAEAVYGALAFDFNLRLERVLWDGTRKGGGQCSAVAVSVVASDSKSNARSDPLSFVIALVAEK